MLSPSDVSRKAQEAAVSIREALGDIPDVAVVLGSGWDALVDGIQSERSIDFESIPGFCRPSVPGHPGRIKVVEAGGGSLIVQEGRLHRYEGCSALDVTFPVWTYSALGVRLLVMFSAGGGLNPTYIPGDLMLVADHILLLGENPLIGLPGAEGRSPHTPAADLYPQKWRDVLESCLPEGTRCHQGNYIYVTGPSYETNAEAQLLRVMGGDAVGMSTAPEALTCRYLGMDAVALCCISNTVLPFSSKTLTHDAVVQAVRQRAGTLEGFLDRLSAEVHTMF